MRADIVLVEQGIPVYSWQVRGLIMRILSKNELVLYIYKIK
jgi:hypothetical protein